MSVVITVKDKGRYVLGADKQASTGQNKDHTCTKIWAVEELPGAILGSVGSARASQVIQYAQILDLNELNSMNANEFDTGYIVRSVVPTLVGTLKAHGIQCTTQEDTSCTIMPNAFIFAFNDRAWMIWNDLSVTEIGDYLAIGSGSDVATGALFATPDKNPFERIVTAIDAAAETTLFVDNGVDLLCTAECDNDKELALRALGYEDELAAYLAEKEKATEDISDKKIKKKNKKGE